MRGFRAKTIVSVAFLAACGPTFGSDMAAEPEEADAAPAPTAPTYPDAAATAAPGDGAICAEVEVHVEQVVPTVMLLIDRSISMSLGFSGSPNRWEAIYNTLMGSSGLVRNLEGDVRFGLALYTSFNGFSSGTCPVLHQVPPALNNYGPIEAVYGPIGLGEDTPTGASVFAIIPGLHAYPEPGPKIIVLATDGLPDTCGSPDPDGQQAAKDFSISAVQSAFTNGIETYVISVGPDIALDHLQHLANAGRGMSPSGGNAPYYRALDTGSLVSAFDAILDGVRTCSFTLNGTVDPDSVNDGHVFLDGVEIPADQWELPDATTLEITGPACTILMSGGNHDVHATWPCDGIVID
jgi:hypothetical protein